MPAQILAPAAVLIAWSLLMLVWAVVTRVPALNKMKVGIKDTTGKRGQDLEGVLPDPVMWKSHNYAHLMEQPTLFYAAIFVLAIAGHDEIDAIAAWAYVAIRVVHSLWQATVNTIPVRLSLFTLSTICLVVLAIKALMATLFGGIY